MAKHAAPALWSESARALSTMTVLLAVVSVVAVLEVAFSYPVEQSLVCIEKVEASGIAYRTCRPYRSDP